MPMKRAAQSPVDSREPSRPTSLANRYVAKAVRPEKAGASCTQTSRMSTGMLTAWRAFQIRPDVTMSPGYRVPPTTRPSGYQAVGSNQFQNSCLVSVAAGRCTYVDALLGEDLGRAEVEPGIKLVDDGLEAHDGKLAGGNGGAGNDLRVSGAGGGWTYEEDDDPEEGRDRSGRVRRQLRRRIRVDDHRSAVQQRESERTTRDSRAHSSASTSRLPGLDYRTMQLTAVLLLAALAQGALFTSKDVRVLAGKDFHRLVKGSDVSMRPYAPAPPASRPVSIPRLATARQRASTRPICPASVPVRAY